jgi:2-oxoglutarate-dependent dioxygenase
MTPRVCVKPLQLTAGELHFYNSEGYLLIPGLISEREAIGLRDEVMEYLEKLGMLGTTKLRQTHEYLAGGFIDALVNSPALHSIASQLMGGDASLYYPFTAVKTVGGGRFNFHQDNQYTRFDGPGINCWFALSEMSPENGCLQVIPRSHLNGTLESDESEDKDGHKKVRFEPKDFLPVRMRPGDCIAFSRLTVHGSGANQSHDPRVAYAVQYYRSDVKYLDKSTGEWKLLRDKPRFTIKPVEKLSVPTEKIDGH